MKHRYLVLFVVCAISFFNNTPSFSQSFEDYPLKAYTPNDFFTVGEVLPIEKGQALCVSKEDKGELVKAQMDLKEGFFLAYDSKIERPAIKGCSLGYNPVLFTEGSPFQVGSIPTVMTKLENSDHSIENNSINGKGRKLTLNGQTYTLQLKKLSPMWFAIDLSLEGKRQRIVKRYTNSDNVYAEIRWAGDLDQDGKLDFLLDYISADGGAGWSRTLFLSSHANKNDLVKPASKYFFWTCWLPQHFLRSQIVTSKIQWYHGIFPEKGSSNANACT